MVSRADATEQVDDVQVLRQRLHEAEETLRAIKQGEVDALLIEGPEGPQTYTLTAADRPYRFMIEEMQEGAVTVSEEGFVLYCNRRFAEMAGMALERVIGMAMTALVQPDEQERMRAVLAAAGALQGAKAEFLLRGQVESVPVVISATEYVVGEHPVICLIVTDITGQILHAELEGENRLLEDMVAQRAQESERRAQQLQMLAGELSRVEQQERRRIAQMLHDGLQQLLAAGKMRISFLERQTQEDSFKKELAQVRHLLTECIKASRSLTVELSPPILYERGLPQALEWLARHFEQEHQLKVEVLLEGPPDSIDENIRTFVFQAARELLFNTVKYSGVKDAQVRLAAQEGNWLFFEVADHGVGCDWAERVHRLNVEQGFGLFSIQQRVELFGGKMETCSSPGNGFCTWMRLPIAPSSVAEEEEAPLPAVKREASAAKHNGRRGKGRTRVLLVDDHKVLRKGLAMLLLSEPNVEVVGEAGDGLTAIAKARELAPDVIVMDVTMPVMNGVEATRRIKREMPDVRIIGLSMHEANDMALEMIQAGAERYLSKDTASAQLLAALKAW
jgi:PAS domain S-box-containing protein